MPSLLKIKGVPLNRAYCLWLFAICFLPGILQAQNKTYKRVSVGVSVPVKVKVTDVSVNKTAVTDNSKPELEKFVSLTADFKQLAFNGNAFSGDLYSDAFFTYKEVISIKGELAADQKSILWADIKSVYTQFSGDIKSWYSTADKITEIRLENLPLSFGSQYAVKPGVTKVTKVQYTSKTFEQRYFDRNEKYEEEYLSTNITLKTPISGSISIVGIPVVTGTAIIKEPGIVTVRISTANKSILEKSLGTLLTAELSTHAGILLKEGMELDKLTAEGQLSKTGLLSEDTRIDTVIQKKMLSQGVDVEVLIYSKLLSGDEVTGTYQHTIKVITSAKMYKLDYMRKGSDDLDSVVQNASVSILHTGWQIKNSK